MGGQGIWSGVKDDTIELFGTFCCCLMEADRYFCCMPKLFLLTQFVTLVLQLVGTFTDHWIYTTDCKNMGLKSTCMTAYNSSSNVTDYDPVYELDGGGDLYALQIASFSMSTLCLLVAVAAMIRLQNLDSESKKPLQISCFSCVLPVISMVSGFLNFVGCMVVTSEGFSLGYSLYMCLSSGIVLMTISALSITGYFCMKRNGCDW